MGRRWQRTDRPAVERPAALIFAADHGVAAAEGQRLPDRRDGGDARRLPQGADDQRLRRRSGPRCSAVDVGVGTADRRHPLRSGDDPARFDEVADAGRGAVDALDADLLVLGEMGIGNTTAAAAIAAALAGGEVARVGRARHRRRRRRHWSASGPPCSRRCDRIVGVTDPLEVLREVGGAELVAMAAAVVAARHRSVCPSCSTATS